MGDPFRTGMGIAVTAALAAGLIRPATREDLDPEARAAAEAKRLEERERRHAEFIERARLARKAETARRAAMTPSQQRYEDARKAGGYRPHQSAREMARAARRLAALAALDKGGRDDR